MISLSSLTSVEAGMIQGEFIASDTTLCVSD